MMLMIDRYVKLVIEAKLKENGIKINEGFIIKVWANNPYSYDGKDILDNIGKVVDLTNAYNMQSVLIEDFIKIKNIDTNAMLFLRAIASKWNWITKDLDGNVSVFNTKPYKNGSSWVSDSAWVIEMEDCIDSKFEFISWLDNEPKNIQTLIKSQKDDGGDC